MKTAASACLLLALTSPVTAQEAVVKVYATHSGGTSQGSGFFSSSNGQVTTAHHVIDGARKIEIFHERLGSSTNLQVEFIAPEYDLAILQVNGSGWQTPSLALDFSPDFAAELRLSGFPRGGVLQEARGHAARRGFVNSLTINDPQGRALFRSPIDVVAVDISVYQGMSGGPVVGPKGVIGVLSASWHEGRGIGWAIPVKYLKSMSEVRRRPAEVRWPALTLMTAAWRNARSSVRVNTTASAAFDEFRDSAEAAVGSLYSMQRQAVAVRTNLAVHRPFLERVASDSKLRNDSAAASAYLDPTGALAFRSLREFFEIATQYGDEGQRFSVATTNLVTWLDTQKADKAGNALGREMRDLRQEISDMRGGIDAYLGIDSKALLAARAALVDGLKRTEGRAGEQARVQLQFVDAWSPAIAKYASPQALMFNARASSIVRRMTRILEPFIYQPN